ncbi:MAG TPA: O-antigen ligase family protein, partial [Chloroflexota bacterium]|nr:O-antigen ligase family protein [Chloroflexota bacterium]
ALVLTFSRAGILAALLAMTIMAILSVARGHTRPAAYLALATLAVPLALVWTAAADPGLDRRLTAGLDESGSLSPSRLDYWSAAWRMAIDHPLLGVGPDNYRWAFAAYSGVDVDNLGVHAHNQLLDTLASTGVFGLLALLLLLFTLLRTAASRLARSSDAVWPWRLALLGSLGAWLAHGLLDDFEHFWPASVAFWLIAGLAVRLARFEAAQDPQQGLGRVALGRELDARPQRLAAVLGSTAQRDDLAVGAHRAQPLQVATRQPRQVPVEQDDVGATAHDLVDQAGAGRALRHD